MAELGRKEISEVLLHVANERLLENPDDATVVEASILIRAARFFDEGPGDTLELAGFLVAMADRLLVLGDEEGIDPAKVGSIMSDLLNCATNIKEAERVIRLPVMN